MITPPISVSELVYKTPSVALKLMPVLKKTETKNNKQDATTQKR